MVSQKKCIPAKISCKCQPKNGCHPNLTASQKQLTCMCQKTAASQSGCQLNMASSQTWLPAKHGFQLKVDASGKWLSVKRLWKPTEVTGFKKGKTFSALSHCHKNILGNVMYVEWIARDHESIKESCMLILVFFKCFLMSSNSFHNRNRCFFFTIFIYRMAITFFLACISWWFDNVSFHPKVHWLSFKM